MAARKVRAIFLSDTHLGTRACQAGRLLDFLKHHESEPIYLVGDIAEHLDGRFELVEWGALGPGSATPPAPQEAKETVPPREVQVLGALRERA